jgi:N6-adenosine-specific RNA methylase IME4
MSRRVGASLKELNMELTRYEAARRALAEAHAVDEVKDIRDKALALEAYASQARDSEMQRWAAEIKLRAERRAGELLSEMKENGERHSGHGDQIAESSQSTPLPTLADLNITGQQSSDWQAIAALPEEKFEAAIASPLVVTTKQLAREAREARRRIRDETLLAPPLPEGKYSVIYADPPWRYEAGTINPERDIENHYPTLLLDEIKALPVSEIAARDCVLFLWFPPPKVEEAPQVARAWGFIPRTCATWDKEIIGPGHYFRQQFELLLLAIKGTPGTPAPADRPPSYYRERRGKHSKKPQYYRALIERMYPQARRIELFARESRPGWTAWGNEVDLERRFLVRPAQRGTSLS